MKLHLGPEARPSNELIDTIERMVRVRTGGTVRGLRVEVGDNGIVLSGRASTYYTKQLATQAALETAEDVNLTNNIEVC